MRRSRPARPRSRSTARPMQPPTTACALFARRSSRPTRTRPRARRRASARRRPGLDTIDFAIPGAGSADHRSGLGAAGDQRGGLHQRLLASGTSANTNALNAGINAVLLIELNETSEAGGLTINATGTTPERPRSESGTSADKITVNASNVTIAGNFIGTNPAGTAALPGSSGGFAIRQLYLGSNNVIGGGRRRDRETSCPAICREEIIVENGDNTRSSGNYIGTDVAGKAGVERGLFPTRRPHPGRSPVRRRDEHDRFPATSFRATTAGPCSSRVPGGGRLRPGQSHRNPARWGQVPLK